MSTRSKFLPALALVVALAPFAANARSTSAPVQDTAHPVHLVGAFAGTQAQSHGRFAAVNVPTGLYAVDAKAQYAAINSLPQEN